MGSGSVSEVGERNVGGFFDDIERIAAPFDATIIDAGMVRGPSAVLPPGVARRSTTVLG
ncbi:hypothetical protein ABIB83_007257 [Bradyrhizobium sp. I1.8.5]|uniref:hypothetical protein n=1 Tax=unclassified Bradyrhizobium TaxID=2631580 RepID=UPI00339AD48D